MYKYILRITEAEKVVLGYDKLRTTIEQLFMTGRTLERYSHAHRLFLSFEDEDGDPELKALFDALDSLSEHTQRSSEVMKTSYLDVNNASFNGMDRLRSVFKKAKKDIETDKFVLEKSISQAEDTLKRVSSKLASRKKRRIYQLLREIDELIKSAKKVAYELSDDSIVLLKKAKRAKKDISEVRHQATTRLELTGSITGKK
ncbi:hypothetical protein PoB_004273100 [Plakobranchus ocellatus]|uniref:Uncharacterized protein n=1 Tax=Plakobranchus ocellatus TaxID=259542 RepID=A0AAV4AYP5_9GAST|nr:hypothetical protein PoB_004273100 [Plakobranchus ocellatus]